MQSPEDLRACNMQKEVSELEALVCAACTKGVESARCRDVIQDAVTRARRKSAMLPHLDSSLLLSALEQAKQEIASLSDVTATNAEVMHEELLHHQQRAEEQAAGSSEGMAAASVLSLPGSGAEVPPSPSIASTPQEGDASGHGGSAAGGGPARRVGSAGMLAPPTPKPAALGPGPSPADAVAAMRDFASEVAAEVDAEAEEQRTFRHSLSMKASKSGDFRLAASYDFDFAVSPRAAYHVRDPLKYPSGQLPSPDYWEPPPPRRGFSADAGTAGAAGEEEEQEEDRMLMYSRSPEPAAGGGGEEEEEENAEGEAADVVSPIAGLRAVAAGRMHTPRGGEGLCCEDLPPGFNPFAEVEGGMLRGEEAFDREPIDPQSPTGVGAVDLLSYSSAPYSLHTVTPPRHVLRELAAEVQGRLRL